MSPFNEHAKYRFVSLRLLITGEEREDKIKMQRPLGRLYLSVDSTDCPKSLQLFVARCTCSRSKLRISDLLAPKPSKKRREAQGLTSIDAPCNSKHALTLRPSALLPTSRTSEAPRASHYQLLTPRRRQQEQPPHPEVCTTLFRWSLAVPCRRRR